jgi:hypothetical protein
MTQMSKSPVADHQGDGTGSTMHVKARRVLSGDQVGFHAIPTPVPTRTTLDPSAFMM